MAEKAKRLQESLVSILKQLIDEQPQEIKHNGGYTESIRKAASSLSQTENSLTSTADKMAQLIDMEHIKSSLYSLYLFAMKIPGASLVFLSVLIFSNLLNWIIKFVANKICLVKFEKNVCITKLVYNEKRVREFEFSFILPIRGNYKKALGVPYSRELFLERIFWFFPKYNPNQSKLRYIIESIRSLLYDKNKGLLVIDSSRIEFITESIDAFAWIFGLVSFFIMLQIDIAIVLSLGVIGAAVVVKIRSYIDIYIAGFLLLFRGDLKPFRVIKWSENVYYMILEKGRLEYLLMDISPLFKEQFSDSSANKHVYNPKTGNDGNEIKDRTRIVSNQQEMAEFVRNRKRFVATREDAIETQDFDSEKGVQNEYDQSLVPIFNSQDNERDDADRRIMNNTKIFEEFRLDNWTIYQHGYRIMYFETMNRPKSTTKKRSKNNKY